MLHWGFMLERGLGRPADAAAALDWYHRAALAGSPAGANNLGKLLLEGPDAGEEEAAAAVSWLRRAGTAGSASARAALGYCYAAGLGVARDATASEGHYARAAALGHPGALVHVAEGHLAADRVDAALACLQAAAKGGSAEALFHLAALTEAQALDLTRGGAAAAGVGPEDRGPTVAALQRDAQALYWRAAEMGEPRALLWIGNAHWDGGQVEQALQCWYAAARRGHAPALVLLGGIAERGEGGVERDEGAALKCYRLAVQQGSVEAAEAVKRLTRGQAK